MKNITILNQIIHFSVKKQIPNQNKYEEIEKNSIKDNKYKENIAYNNKGQKL